MPIKIVYSTVPNINEAKNIAKTLIEQKLAACVNISSKIISIYEWDSKICEDEEYQLFIKTTQEMTERVISKIEEIHPYDIPAIMVIPTDKASEEFTKWVENSVTTNHED